MKKLLIISAIFIALCTNVYASKTSIIYRPLNDSAGVALSNFALTSGSAVFSETINITNTIGFNSILITENKSGGAGDVDISAEYSLDGTNWFTAYISDMAGVITAEGNIVTALQDVTRLIVYTPRISRLLRFKFDPDADSQITVSVIFQEN